MGNFPVSKEAEREADQSPLSSAEVKNKLHYSSSPPPPSAQWLLYWEPAIAKQPYSMKLGN
jgi:hypothetical protein